MFAKTSRSFLCGLIALALIGPLGSTIVSAGDDGQAAFTAQKCNMCHSVPQADIEAKMKSEKLKGPDLPAAARDAEWLTGFLKREVQLNGADHKKEFKGTDEELQAIAAWLGTLKSE